MSFAIHNRQNHNAPGKIRAKPFALAQALVLFGLAGLQINLLLTGANLLYQAPRMQPFMIFSTIAFLAMGLYALWAALTPGAATPLACGCSSGPQPSWPAKTATSGLFGLVLLTGFLLPHQLLDSRVAEKKGISLHRSASAALFGPQPTENIFPDDHLSIETIPWDTGQAASQAPEHGDEQDKLHAELGVWYDRDLHTRMADELLAEQTLTVTDASFLDAMLIISAYLDAFQGRILEFSGFVFHDQSMAANELAVARIAVTCCLADSTVYGLLVRAPDLPLPANDAWVRIRGRIHKTQFMGEDIPLVVAQRLDVVPSPEQPYVYPRLYSKYVFENQAK